MSIPSVAIAVPASMVSDVPGLELKTFKVGQVGRAAAIYRVERILIYPDRNYQKQIVEIRLISLLLRYMETPQYLRRQVFGISHDLKYAGTLPPLNTRHHPTIKTSSGVQNGEFREGLVIRSDSTGSLADIGLERPFRIRGAVSKEGRMTFQVRKSEKEIQLIPANRSETHEYWGYEVVETQQALGELMKKKAFDLQILTSRTGSPISELADEMENRLLQARNILIAFGSPKEGLKEILEREGFDQSVADYTVNTIPQQGTLSVRTEEAVHATLAILNSLIHGIRRKIHKTHI